MTVDEMVTTITDKIKQANAVKTKECCFEPKQKWFDWKCFRLRSIMLKNFKTYNNNLSANNRIRYLTSKARFLQVCREKKIITPQ